MPNTAPTHSLFVRALKRAWLVTRAVYRYVNLLSHHTLGFLVKALIVLYFIFGCGILFLRYAVLPQVNQYKADIEHYASRQLGHDVTAKRIYASWNGLNPQLILDDVILRDKNAQVALRLPRVASTLSWWSIPFMEVRFKLLEFINPQLDILRNTDGTLVIAGIALAPQHSGENRGADWLLTQENITILNGNLRWTDLMRQAPTLELHHVNLHLSDQWKTHRIGIQASPQGEISGPIDLRAEFTHPNFTRTLSDFSKWKGQVYADLNSANLARLNQYIDLPLAIHKGYGSVRTWVNFDLEKITHIRADFKLDDLQVQLQKNLDPLVFKRISGQANFSFPGSNTQDRPQYRFSNLVFTTPDDPNNSPRVNLGYAPEYQGLPQLLDVNAQGIDVPATLALVKKLPLRNEIKDVLENIQASGTISSINAHLKGTVFDPKDYRLQARFSNISINNPENNRINALAPDPAARAGISNLSGALNLSRQGGSAQIASDKSWANITRVLYPQTLEFDHLKLNLRWEIHQDGSTKYTLDQLSFEQQGTIARAFGTYQLKHPFPSHQDPGIIQLNATLSKADVRRVRGYLPTITHPQTYEWLSNALESGYAEDVHLRLAGNLAEFPFKSVPGKASSGEFIVAGKIVDGRLNYAPGHFAPDGKSPQWPQAEHIQGRFEFNRTRMEIDATTASTLGVPLTNVRAIIPDLTTHDPILLISGNGAGRFQQFLDYVKASPVYEWIAKFTENTQATGNATVKLELALPLDRLHESKVNGNVKFLNNDIYLIKNLSLLSSTTGSLNFSEHGFDLNNVSSTFLGGRASITGGLDASHLIKISARGTLTANGISAEYTAPALKPLLARLTGNTQYAATVAVAQGHAEVRVESHLQGMSINLPAPFGKKPEDKLSTVFFLKELPSPSKQVQKDEFSLSVGSLINAQYQRQKDAAPNASWQVSSAGIGINTLAPQPERGLSLNVDLPEIALDNWITLFSGLLNHTEGPRTPHTPSTPNLFTQYLLPQNIALQTQKLTVAGQNLTHVVLGASSDQGNMDINFASDQASGFTQWTAPNERFPNGKISAKFAHVNIVHSTATGVSHLLGQKQKMFNLPEINVEANEFNLFGLALGKIAVSANNVMNAGHREWRIKSLSIKNPDAKFTAKGKWRSDDTRDETSLEYQLSIHDSGDLLKRLGFPGVLAEGHGSLSGKLHWAGSPFAFDIPSLSGDIVLNLRSGHFLKVDPAAAKLLGIISLQALPRFFKLDFQDMFTQGFAFSEVTANASLMNGIMASHNFKMIGPGASVLIEGSTDLSKETQDLTVVVTPNVNAGAVSVIYAIAINPVIGLGTFLAQLFLNHPLAKAFTFAYHVSGSWAHPVIIKTEVPNE